MSQALRSFPSEYVPLGTDDVSAMSPSPILKRFSIDNPKVEEKSVEAVPSSFRRIVLRFWLTEWIAWLIAFGAIASIVAVLLVFNGQSLPDWPFGITLSALVSLLATLATVALMVPISSAVGQSQWIWFMRERHFRDFDLIDEASRSPFGSLRLIFRWRGGIFALSGALLTIIILALAPFSQQVVQYAEKTIDSSAASLSVATEYNTADTSGRDVDLSMKAAVQRAILDVDATKNTFSIFPQCSTGNCTWDKYTSLSVCAQCADISSDIKITSNNDTGMNNAALPNKVNLDYLPSNTADGLIAMVVNTTNPNQGEGSLDSLKFTDVNLPLLNVFTLIPTYGVPSDVGLGPFASECLLQFCVQNYSSKSVSGKFTETSLGEPQYIKNDQGVNNLTVGDKTYWIQYDTLEGISTYFDELFNARVEPMRGLSTQMQWTNDVSQSLFTWTNNSADHLPTGLFENMAASMTLNLRSRSDEVHSGIANATKTVVSVNWYWMILPFVILAMVFFYLIAIIVISRVRGLPPWRCSILAPLMHGCIDDSSRNLVNGVSRLEEMEALAEVLKAKSVYSAVAGEEGKHLGLSVREA